MRIIACHVVLLMLISLAGCRQPTADDRDNQRVVECLLTAICLHNPRLLEDDARWASARHTEGHFTDDEYTQIESFITQARQGDWIAAEKAAYAFRKEHPFVKFGQ